MAETDPSTRDRLQAVRRWMLVAGVVATLGLLAWLFVSWTRYVPLVPRLARQAQEIAAPLETASLLDERAIVDIQAMALDARASTGVVPSQTVERAIGCAIGWMRACSSGEPGEYRSWAESSGYSFRDSFPSTSASDPDRWRILYGLVTGTPRDDPPTPGEYFDAVLRSTLSMAGGALRPERLVIDPKAIEIDTMVFTHPADTFDYMSPVHPGGFDTDFWYGGITVGGERFWDPPISLAEIIQSNGKANATRLRLVFVGKNGLRVPVHFVLIDDPKHNVVFIQSVRMTNIGPETGTGLDRIIGLVY